MAEIGIIASIAGIAAAGTKLSVALFDFGSTIGSAGHEIAQVASEILLFCAVLKQVQSKLKRAKSSRYSLGAIQTTQEILDRCEHVFKEIETIIDSLRKENVNSRDSIVDWKARIKWTFKRSHIQLQRTTLESCKITLHIMLTTLDFDRRTASRRTSTVETEKEDEEERTLTKSLIIAHQCTVNALEELEATQPKDIIDGMSALSVTDQSASVIPADAKEHGEVVIADKHAEPEVDYLNSRVKRASLWANSLVYGSSELAGSFSRNTVTDDTSHQMNYFLQKWINQVEPTMEAPKDTETTLQEQQPPFTISERYVAQLKTTYYSANNAFDQLEEYAEKNTNLSSMERRALSIRSSNLDEFLVAVNRELLEVKQYNQLNSTLAATSRTLKLGTLDSTTTRSLNLDHQKVASGTDIHSKVLLPKKSRSKNPATKNPATRKPKSPLSSDQDVAEILAPPKPLVAVAKPRKTKIKWHLDQNSLPSSHGRYPYPLVSPNSTSQAILSGIGLSLNYVLFVKYAGVEHRIERHETPSQVWNKMSVFKIDLLSPILVLKHEAYAFNT